MTDIEPMDAGAIEILDREVVYQGFSRVRRLRLRHPLYAGGTSAELTREVIERGHAVTVIPYDPRRDEVVMIEQLRIGALARGDAAPWLLEVIAGIVEEGEDPADVARREAKEEAGLDLADVREIYTHYTSPGIMTETITLYHAEIDAGAAGGLHGLAVEGEDIRVLVLGFDQAMAAIEDGRISSGPAILALQWLALNRMALRAAAGIEGSSE